MLSNLLMQPLGCSTYVRTIAIHEYLHKIITLGWKRFLNTKTNKVNSQQLFRICVLINVCLLFKRVSYLFISKAILYISTRAADSVYLCQTSQRLDERNRQRVPKSIRNRVKPKKDLP